MRRINESTVFEKKIFPVMHASVGLAIVAFVAYHGAALPPWLPIVLVAGIGVSFLLQRRRTAPFADEVWDAGDHLVFRTGSNEQRVRFTHIDQIENQAGRVTVRLHSGRPLLFTLPGRPRDGDALVDDLTRRARAARH